MQLYDAQIFARQQLNKHGLQQWHFEFDNAKSRFGCTKYARRTITLSRELTRLNDEKEVFNTILHEVAHALVGGGHNHDKLWQATAVAIGCSGERGYSSSIVATPQKAWTGTCPNGHSTQRHRRNIGGACGKCCKAFNHGYYSADYLLTWERN